MGNNPVMTLADLAFYGHLPEGTLVMCLDPAFGNLTAGRVYEVELYNGEEAIEDDTGSFQYLTGVTISQFQVAQPATETTSRKDVLDTAAELIGGDRAADYGDAETMHKITGNIWAEYLGVDEIRPDQVAMMMVLLKVARSINSPKLDTYVDIAGYAALAGEMTDTLR